MIRAMHYLAGGLLILAFAYQIQMFYNLAAGIMFGLGLGSWFQYKYEIEL